jgi:hypothetical protein
VLWRIYQPSKEDQKFFGHLVNLFSHADLFSMYRMIVSLRTKTAWLQEVPLLKPNWFLCILWRLGVLLRMSRSNTWARQFEIERVRILFTSFVLCFGSFIIGLMIERLKFFGITERETKLSKKSSNRSLKTSLIKKWFNLIINVCLLFVKVVVLFKDITIVRSFLRSFF